MRKRCKFHVNAAFADAECRVGRDHVGVTYRLAVAFPSGHGGRARPSYAADYDLACRNGRGGRARPSYAADYDVARRSGPGCLVLSA